MPPTPGIIREYVKQSSQLMLDIRDMSNKDKLWWLIEGLKPWAQIEFNRRGVSDLTMAIVETEQLTDLTYTKGKNWVKVKEWSTYQLQCYP